MTTVTPLRCRTALNRVRGMGFGWSLNPYRGCAHACVYCFARATHTHFELGAGSDFSTHLFAKLNIAAVLESEVSARRWRREPVAVGTATDPYQPVEARHRLTRACLEVLARHRTPAHVVTKGPMVRRDTDVLQDVCRRAGGSVCLSIPTVDEEIWRRTEPGTAAPRHRLLAVRHLARAGIRVGVLLAPLLPGISANGAGIAATVAAAAEHGACFVEANMLYLKADVREHYFEFLATHYPALLPQYRHLYGGISAPAAWRARAQAVAREASVRYGVADRRTVRLQPPPRPMAQALPLEALSAAAALGATAGAIPPDGPA